MLLRQYDDLSLHPQVVMKSANVGICAGMREGYPEPREEEWRLGKPNPLLRRSENKSRMHVVGGRVDYRVECPHRHQLSHCPTAEMGPQPAPYQP